MLENLKSKLNSPAAQTVKEIAKNAATAIVVGITVKAVTYIAVEGTKALIEEIRNRNTGESAE